MNTLAERLKYAMEVLPLKKVKGVDLARAAGVKPPSVSDWLSGKSKTMEGENLLKAAKFLGVNPLWLASGVGEIKTSQTQSQSNQQQNQSLDFSIFAGNFQLQKLVEKLMKLNSEKKLTSKDLIYLDHFLDTVAKASDNDKSALQNHKVY